MRCRRKAWPDSGILDSDLPDVFIAIGEAAAEADTAVAIVLDEMQYLSEQELGALIMAVRKVSQERLPVIKRIMPDLP